MPKFIGDYQETFVVDVPVAKAKEHFANPEIIAEHHGDLKSWDKVSDDTIHYVLVPKSEKGVTFNGEYKAKYTWSGEHKFAWSTVETQNLWSTGSTEFQALGDDRTRITWTQHMECEMKVNRFLAAVIKGIVSREISKGGKEFLNRMRGALPR